MGVREKGVLGLRKDQESRKDSMRGKMHKSCTGDSGDGCTSNGNAHHDMELDT